jgi:hypothetical protein
MKRKHFRNNQYVEILYKGVWIEVFYVGYCKHWSEHVTCTLKGTYCHSTEDEIRKANRSGCKHRSHGEKNGVI